MVSIYHNIEVFGYSLCNIVELLKVEFSGPLNYESRECNGGEVTHCDLIRASVLYDLSAEVRAFDCA